MFNFKIEHQNNHLDISRGFLAHKTMQLKLNRIQTIQLRQTN
ncbi:PH domain-containing protein [Leuconostoc mesenteroides]